MHDGDLEHCHTEEKKIDVHMILFSFLNSGIPDTALGILKMLIHVCFNDLLQRVVYWFVPGIMRLPACFYRKCTVFTVSLCSLQVLAICKKVLS